MTTSTNAMDMEEGGAITKMILDKTKVKARQVQRRSRLIKGCERGYNPETPCNFSHQLSVMSTG